MCKSLVYAHERELRVATWPMPQFDSDTRRLKAPPGFFVHLELESLVPSLVVSPLAPSWFEDVVRSAIARYGLDFAIRRSLASAEPIY